MLDSDINQIMRPKKECLCKSVSKADIENAVKGGASTFHQLVKATNATTGCGTCLLAVKANFEEAKSKFITHKDQKNLFN